MTLWLNTTIHTKPKLCNTGTQKILNEGGECKICYNNSQKFYSDMASLTPNFLCNFASSNNLEINCRKFYTQWKLAKLF